MSITLENYSAQDKKIMKKLYVSAFPVEERAPFFMVVSKAKKGSAELLTARKNGSFAGMVYMVCNEKLAYIFYLAVDEAQRGKGIGGEIIKALKERYKGRRIFLAREQLEESAENYSQRLSRRNFYLRCGFEDLPCSIKEGPVTYDVMGIGGNVSAAEYDELITGWCGKFLKKIIDMKIIER